MQLKTKIKKREVTLIQNTLFTVISLNMSLGKEDLEKYGRLSIRKLCKVVAIKKLNK